LPTSSSTLLPEIVGSASDLPDLILAFAMIGTGVIV